MQNNLIFDYNSSVNLIIEEFINKWYDSDDFDATSDIQWINHVGGVFMFGDYYINFSDVLIDIDYETPKGLFEQWYDDTLEFSMDNGENEDVKTLSYEEYVNGNRYKDILPKVNFIPVRSHMEIALKEKTQVKKLEDVLKMVDFSIFKGRISNLTCKQVYLRGDNVDKNSLEYYNFHICGELDNDEIIVLGFTDAEIK